MKTNIITGITSFLVSLLIISASLQAQVIITVPGFPSSLVKPDMLWNLVVVNKGESFQGIIKLVVTDKNNRNVLSGYSSPLNFPKGAKSIFYTTVSPVNYTYNQLGSNNEWFKVGKYNVCYTLTLFNQNTNNTIFGANQNKSEVIDYECEELNIEPINPPLLNQPDNKSSIYDAKPAFIWQPPAPMQIFTDLKYEVRLVEIAKGQSAAQAITKNSPILTENELRQPSILFPPSYNPLEVNHNYAWQVTAYNSNYSIKSEFWQFKVVEDTIQKIVQQSPFLLMNNVNTVAIGTMQQGYIKVIIDNSTNDSLATLCLSELGDPTKCIVTTNVSLKPGENYIVKQIAGKVRLNEKKIYQLIWVSSGNEKMILRYKPKYYN